jgi:hypothetical protein
MLAQHPDPIRTAIVIGQFEGETIGHEHLTEVASVSIKHVPISCSDHASSDATSLKADFGTRLAKIPGVGGESAIDVFRSGVSLATQRALLPQIRK